MEGTKKIQNIADETILLRKDEFLYYDFKLKKGDNLKGEISSESPIDIFILDEKNFEKVFKGKSFEDKYGSEDVLQTKIDYVESSKGTRFFVMINRGKTHTRVTVNLYVISS